MGWLGSHTLNISQAPEHRGAWGATITFGYAVIHVGLKTPAHVDRYGRRADEHPRLAEGESVLLEQIAREAARIDVETQLAWLRQLGYDDVDCCWKRLEMALLVGLKPAEAA